MSKLKNFREDIKRDVSDPFGIQFISGEINCHCDVYPFGSFHMVQEDKDGNLWDVDRIHSVSKDFKLKKVDIPSEVKSCSGCLNKFPLDWTMVGNICVRCFERKHFTYRDEYREIIRKELIQELKLGNESN